MSKASVNISDEYFSVTFSDSNYSLTKPTREVLHACLEAYEDPETGMSGVEMLESGEEHIRRCYDRKCDDVADALRRLLSGEGGDRE